MAATSFASRATLSPLCRQTQYQSASSLKDACIPIRGVQAKGFNPEVTIGTRINLQRSSRTLGRFGGKQIVGVRRQKKLVAASLASESDSTNDGNVTEFFTDEDFQKHLKDAGDKLVVVDISTKTCGPCKMIYPKVVEMSEEFTDAVFLKIQGDHDNRTRGLMREWKVSSVPSFRFYRKGELIHAHTGAKVDKLMDEFQKHYTSVNA